MGLFGGKKIYVASTCYNLAGDETLRPNYLKTVVTSSVVGSNSRSSIADSVHQGYMSGPGLKLRAFYRWADTHYNSVIGLDAAGIASAPNIDPAVIAAHIPAGATIQMIRVDSADMEIWAEQWILANHPTLINSAWTADYDDNTGLITVSLPGYGDNSFTPSGFNKTGVYVYAAYNTSSSGGEDSIIMGVPEDLATGAPFPDTTGWTGGGSSWYKIEPFGDDGTGRIVDLKTYMTFITGTPNQVRYDTQYVNIRDWSPLSIFIYQAGTGIPALDSQLTISNAGGFFPPIPVRVDNAFISTEYLPDEYEISAKAYKRLTAGAKFDELVTKLSENEDLADLDYIFVVPGVSLNARENSSKRYVYEFFDQARVTDLYGESDYNDWSTGLADVGGSFSDWDVWMAGQADPGDPLYGTAEPYRLAYNAAPRNEVRVRTTNASLGYDTRIAWKSIKKESLTGLGKVDAVVGEVWFAKGGSSYDAGTLVSRATLVSTTDSSSEDLLIYFQDTASTYKKLTIRGLVHQNYIYKGKYVEIKAHEALDDTDESGFIIPIHYDTWRSMSLKDTTQMSTACLFLVINTYVVKKKKWYQTGFFKIVLFIAVVIVTVVLFGPEALAANGLLGSSAAIGASLGLTGTLALIAGAIANALAAMIVVKLIGVAATEAFGDTIGNIISAIAALVTLQVSVGLQNGMTMAEALSSLMNPMNLLSLTNALGQGVQTILQAKTADVMQSTQNIMDKYKDASKEISQLYEANIGYDTGTFDPMQLFDVNSWFVESGDSFLTRTLMTGSDLAELSNSLLSRFSELTLSTDLAL